MPSPRPPRPRRTAAALADLLTSRFGVTDPGLGLDLVAELSRRFDLPVAYWGLEDVAIALTGPDGSGPDRQFTAVEARRIRATRDWRLLPGFVFEAAQSAVADSLEAIIAEAMLRCAACGHPVYAAPAVSVGHCRPCRQRIGRGEIRRRGCRMRGMRPHTAADTYGLTMDAPTSGWCRFCEEPIAAGPTPACPASATHPADCSCRIWYLDPTREQD